MNYQTANTMPGIYSLYAYNKTTGKLLAGLNNSILYAESSLNRGTRELLAAYVSQLNNCSFSYKLHSAVACNFFGKTFVNEVLERKQHDLLPPEMQEFFTAAREVWQGFLLPGSAVTTSGFTRISNMQLHDIILLTSVITTYNRFINALGTEAPVLSEEEYRILSKSIHESGYLPVFG